jgi:hypothetical protein
MVIPAILRWRSWINLLLGVPDPAAANISLEHDAARPGILFRPTRSVFVFL